MVANHSKIYGEFLFKEQYLAFWRGKIGDLQISLLVVALTREGIVRLSSSGKSHKQFQHQKCQKLLLVGVMLPAWA